MTKVRFTFVDVQGNPLPGMEFKLLLRRASFNIEDVGVTLPEELVVTTDEQGKALVDLWPLKAAYRIQIAEEFEEICGKLNWSFYVPHSTEIIEAQTLFLVPPPTNVPWDEAALAKITQAVQDTHNDAVSALDSAKRAEIGATTAVASADTAVKAATAANASQQATAQYEASARTSAGTATTKAAEATASATAAKASETSATASKTSATASATSATQSAASATASQNAAKASETSAATSANTATSKAAEATTGGNTATTQAGIATTQADRAKTEADRATAATDGKQPLNNNLTALSSLGGTPDRVPYFTGVGTMAVAAFTAQGRSLVAQSLASDQRNTLGLGSSSTLAATVSLNDNVPNRVLTVGYAGLGRQLSTRQLPNVATNRADVIKRAMGFSLDLIASGDRPAGVVDGPMMTMDFDGNQGLNLMFDWRTGTMYTYTDITPAPIKKWRMCYQEDNVVGTIANKAIIERGSNSNGQFTKYADGTLVCWVSNFTINIRTLYSLLGNWTTPHPFVATTVSPTALSFTISENSEAGMPSTGRGLGTQFTSMGSAGAVASVGYITNASAPFPEGTSAKLNLIAVGRWMA